MSDTSDELLKTVRDIRALLELIAEPAIAQRDAALRSQLRQLVGTSQPKQASIFLMDGTRTQKDIRDETSIHQGNLSTFIGKLNEAKLLVGDQKLPKLCVSIPLDFFTSHAHTE